ncbi:MAG: glycosyltransferase family 2 protein [Candidatus Omnitrophota bacterium]
MQEAASDSPKVLSVVIPARNEARSLPETVRKISATLDSASVPFELIVVDDHSEDGTGEVVKSLGMSDPRIVLVENKGAPGYGYAVRRGLETFKGAAVVIVMADSSDDPADIVVYYTKILAGYECVFGSRFCRPAKVVDYPFSKLLLNRFGNFFIQMLFLLPYNDVSNAFKCYSRRAIEGIQPLISCHFNLTVEMPLKAIVRGYTWCVVPTNWYGRAKGISKWKIKEMGSRYLFVMLYIWLERSLSRNDYRRRQ